MRIKQRTCCYFCGQNAANRQHIPPRSFFGAKPPPDLIVVPSCEAHNQNVADEEEIFRAFAVCPDGVSQTGKEILTTKVLSESARKHRGYKSLRDGAVPINLIRNGLSMPAGLATIDQLKANGFLKRLTRGLIFRFYPNFWSPLLYFCVRQLNGPRAHEGARNALQRLGPFMAPFNKGDSFKCLYGSAGAGRKWTSIWAYSFFDAAEFLVLCSNQCSPEYLD